MSLVPSDDMLLRAIINFQDTQPEGNAIGSSLRKIYDYIKAEHPLWTFSIKRLRTVRKNHNLASSSPSPEREGPLNRQASSSGTSTATGPANQNHTRLKTSGLGPQEARSLDVLQMHLTFHVIAGREKHTYTFTKPVPRTFCIGNSDRDAAFAFVNRLITTCEQEIVTLHAAALAWKCAYCGGPATAIYSSPHVSFTARPPSVVSEASLPVCAVKTYCHGLAHKASVERFKVLKANGLLPRPQNTTEDLVTQHYSLL